MDEQRKYAILFAATIRGNFPISRRNRGLTSALSLPIVGLVVLATDP